MSDNTKHYLLWIDVETTAIKPKDGDLLEVGVAVTDMKGTRLYGPKSIVIKHQSLELNDDTKHAILDMHLANDLINQAIDSSAQNIDLQCDAMMEDLRNQLEGATKDGCTIHVAGTNVQFDIDWLTEAGLWLYFKPYVSHRRLDMSAIRLTLTAVGIDPYKANHKTAHRVDDCLSRDIYDYMSYIEWVTEHMKADEPECDCDFGYSLHELFESEDDE